MKMHRLKIVVAAAASVVAASIAKAAPIVNVQIVGSTSSSAPVSSYSSTLNVTAGQTVYFAVEEELAPSGTVNGSGTGKLTLGTQSSSSDGLSSIGFNLTDPNSKISFASPTTFTIPSIWDGNSQVASAGTASGSNAVNHVAVITNAGATYGATSPSVMLTGNFTVGSTGFTVDTIAPSYDFTNGNGNVFGVTVNAAVGSSTSYNSVSKTTERTTNPYSGYAGLTLAESLYWSGATNGAWDTSTTNFSGSAFSNGSAVTFADTAADGATAVQNTSPITIQSNGVAPATTIFSNTNTAYRLATSGSVGIGGNGSVNIQGGGSVAFSSPNTYTGGTFITNGTLHAAAGSLPTSGNVTIGAQGTLSIGDGTTSAVGTLATGAQTWNGGGSLAVKLNGDGTSDIDGMTGALTLLNASSSSQFNVVLAPGASPITSSQTFEVASFTSLLGYSGTLPTQTGAAGAVTLGNSSQFVLNTSALSGIPSNDFSLSLESLNGGGDGLFVNVNYAATPEPATAVLGLSAVAPMLLARRRRARKIEAEQA